MRLSRFYGAMTSLETPEPGGQLPNRLHAASRRLRGGQLPLRSVAGSSDERPARGTLGQLDQVGGSVDQLMHEVRQSPSGGELLPDAG